MTDKYQEAGAEKVEREKLERIVEMGGAACHELNQPLQAVLGQAELLLLSMPKDSPHYEGVKAIVDNALKMAEITQKIQHITRYKTMPYSDQKIIDIDSASTP